MRQEKKKKPRIEFFFKTILLISVGATVVVVDVGGQLEGNLFYIRTRRKNVLDFYLKNKLRFSRFFRRLEKAKFSLNDLKN